MKWAATERWPPHFWSGWFFFKKKKKKTRHWIVAPLKCGETKERHTWNRRAADEKKIDIYKKKKERQVVKWFAPNVKVSSCWTVSFISCFVFFFLNFFLSSSLFRIECNDRMDNFLTAAGDWTFAADWLCAASRFRFFFLSYIYI